MIMNQSKTAVLTPTGAIHEGMLTQTLWIAGFAGLTALGGQIEIPHVPVPYTLQTFCVLLAGAFLGKRNGAISQLLYLAAGIAGLPVFAQFGFGAAKLLGPTGGYLLAFPIAAFVIGYILENHKNFLWSLVAMTGGLFVIFSLGTLQLYFVYFHDMKNAITGGFLIFSLFDVAKLVSAAAIFSRVAKK
jgi:biotin transport system substrate-specific component